ncbi:hypothetical protein [Streptomyces xanthii]|uniref:Cupin n=1 Tax=Streptomyces xanthii TaxID=2768069 RepID=A0A7H1B2R3_9ACTN|nr:hypothetical protein [Streptomyces xanthii]QNS03018.1 hypothetical protein IAG42_04855 [Streptomyces xanthii]
MTHSPAPASEAPGSGWRRFARAHWSGDPVVVADAPGTGLTAAEAHALLVAAAARPGRTRLTTSNAVLPAPGPLLPGPDDPDTAAYVRRMAAAPELAGDGWLLTATDPLAHDFGLWARVRDVLDGLWRHVGRPALPVTAELAVGDRHHAPDRPGVRADTAGLTWVLDGSLTVRVRPEHTGTEFVLHARAGDLVHWPAGSHHLDQRSGPCTTLRLSVPARRASALPYVSEVLGALMRDDAGPWPERRPLPSPVPAAPDGRIAVPAALRDCAELLRGTLAGRAPERALLLRWAALRSAAGLHPPPPPRPGIAFSPAHRLRRVAEIVRVADGADGPVWAANGHAWPVPASCDRLLTALRGSGTTVAELARAAGLRPASPKLTGPLDALYRARAVDVEPHPGAGRP